MTAPESGKARLMIFRESICARCSRVVDDWDQRDPDNDDNRMTLPPCTCTEYLEVDEE